LVDFQSNGCCNQHTVKVSEPPSLQTQPTAEDFKSYGIVGAVQHGALERVMELVENGYDVNEPDIENVTMLHWAAINNRIEIVK